MDKLDGQIKDALRRVLALIEISRWLWAVNLLVMVVGLYQRNYGLAALAGFTWLLALVGTAVGRRAIRYLSIAEQTIRSAQAS